MCSFFVMCFSLACWVISKRCSQGCHLGGIPGTFPYLEGTTLVKGRQNKQTCYRLTSLIDCFFFPNIHSITCARSYSIFLSHCNHAHKYICFLERSVVYIKDVFIVLVLYLSIYLSQIGIRLKYTRSFSPTLYLDSCKSRNLWPTTQLDSCCVVAHTVTQASGRLALVDMSEVSLVYLILHQAGAEDGEGNIPSADILGD